MTQQSGIKAMMLTVLAILAFTGILSANEVKKRVRGSLLRIIPSESVFCVRVNHLKKTLSSADDFLGGLVPLSYKLTSLLDDDEWKDVNTEGDLALFGMILPGDSPNTNPLADLFVGLLVQVPEYKKLISNNPNISKPDENGISKVGGNGEYGLLITRIGKYALVAWRKDYDKLVKVKSMIGPRKPGLRTALDAKEIKRASKEPIWAYASIQLVGKTFGPIVTDRLNKAKKMLEQIDKAHQGPIENYGMIMDMYAEVLKFLADEVQYVTIAVNPTADVLNVSKTVVARDGTELAEAFVTISRKKRQRNKLFAYLQNDAIMNFAGRINTPFLASIYIRSLDLLTCLDSGMSEEDIAKLKVMMVDQFAAMGENMAFSFLTQKDKPPFALRYVVEISNEKKFNKVLDEQIEMMNSGAFADIYRNLGFKMDMQGKRGVSKYEGVSIDSAKLTLRSTDPNSQQGKMIEAMYGDGFDYRWALVDGHAVYVVGGDVDAHIRTLIDQVKADGPKRPGTEMKSALALLKGRGRTDFVGTFNYIRLLNMVFSMMPQLPNGSEMPLIDMTSKSNLAFAGNLSKGKMTIRAALPKEHIKEVVALFGKIQNKRSELQKKAQPTVQHRKEKAVFREPQTRWHIVEIESKQTEPIAPTQLVPVKGGIWIGDYYLVQHRQPIAFFDFDKKGFTLLFQEGGKSWDAIGYIGLVVQHNRLGLVKLDAQNQLATIWEEKPEGCNYFDYFEAHKGRFYLNSPYNPLWIYDLESRVWTNVELDYVRDADFARLRENYYKPILRRFVLGKNGNVWGFQGTRDATRGNAVCHFFSEKKVW
jgi:hypothetical protein